MTLVIIITLLVGLIVAVSVYNSKKKVEVPSNLNDDYLAPESTPSPEIVDALSEMKKPARKKSPAKTTAKKPTKKVTKTKSTKK